MKKYLAFCWDQYYPSGGWQDFVGMFDTKEEALKELIQRKPDHSQVVEVNINERENILEFYEERI